MGVSVSTFQQRVSRAIKRGKVFDADIPSAAKDAVRSLEDLHDWKFMRRFQENTLTAGTNSITVPNLKNCRSAKWVDSNGAPVTIYKVNEENVVSIDDGQKPVGFWTLDDGITSEVFFDAKPTEDLPVLMVYYVYSDYDDQLPWLRIVLSLFHLFRLILEMVLAIFPSGQGIHRCRYVG